MANLACPSTDTNFLSPNGFQLTIERLPKVAFFCNSVTLPGVSLPPLSTATPLSTVEIPSDKMIFEPLTLTFIVDEKMHNWVEVFNWIRGLGFPQAYDEYIRENDRGVIGLSELSRNYSDAELAILGSNNIPVRRFMFRDCFPTALSGVRMSSDTTDVQYVTADLTLEYSYYTIDINEA